MDAAHARGHGPAAGHACLAELAPSTVHEVLNGQPVKPHKIRYYLERRDPAFDARKAEVLEVYAAAEMVRAMPPADHPVAVLSDDEKPGIQAIATTAPDLPPGGDGQEAGWSGAPQPPVEGPLPTDQVNLTDEDSRIMPVAGGGFDQCYNAQAVVAVDSLLVVAADVVQAPNDKQQLAPMLGEIAALPSELGKVDEVLADTGYFSEANVNACAAAGIAPVIATGREAHHPPLAERHAADPAPPDNPTPVQAMRHRLQTKAGKERYAPRKQTPEPVFGIIKSVLGFRQFLLRGLDNVRGEWKLVTMAWNMKRMFALAGAT